MESILIVDDREDVLQLHAEILGTARYEITTAADPRKALDLVKGRFFDLLVLDDRMHGMSGRELLMKCREHDPDIGAIFVSAFSDPETLTDVIRLGATDYLVKPASESQLQCAVARALQMTRRQRQWRWLRQQIGRDASAGTLLGNCAEIRRIREQMRKIAAQPNIDVLVTGETGTGKELVAAGLHRLSAHAAGPFLVCHLGGLSSSLIAAELFGVSKGAYTNAEEDRVGYFEAAHDGTL
ncbi:sigma-54-dependent transcriptional regulator, partial [Planctomycetota bacterium]